MRREASGFGQKPSVDTWESDEESRDVAKAIGDYVVDLRAVTGRATRHRAGMTGEARPFVRLRAGRHDAGGFRRFSSFSIRALRCLDES